MKSPQVRNVRPGSASELALSTAIGKKAGTLCLSRRGAVSDLVTSGLLNRAIGWLLMVAAFAGTAWLDSRAFHEGDFSVALGNRIIFLRHAQTIVMEIALSQLVTAQLLALPSLPLGARLTSGCLTALGAVATAAGYAAATQWTSSLWLVIAGSLINAMGFMAFARFGSGSRDHRELRVIFLILCFGMLLEAVAASFKLQPELFLPAYIGSEDGLRMRMLRLGRVAALALPVLTLLYRGLTVQADPHSRAARWGRIAMLCGALGMPTVLVAASFTFVEVKALLIFPACAIFAGTLCGAYLAKDHVSPLELWGWLLIALSMAAGMAMGLYAFVAPPQAPHFLAAYNDEARRLIRLAHAYCIVFGLVNIFVARELDKILGGARARRFGARLLVVAGVATIAATLLRAGIDLPPAVLGVGPALVTVALLLCVGIPATTALPNLASPRQRIVGGEL